MSTHNSTNDLIDSIKRRGNVPISQATFTNNDIVEYLNDEMESVLVPLLMSVREEFFVTYTDYTISNNVTSFSIPSNAIGQRLRDVVLVDTNNGDTSYTNLARLTLEQISSNGGSGTDRGFHIQGNKVELYPTTGWDGLTLRLYFFKRPNRLVLENASGKINAINTVTKELSLASLPSSWTTSNTVDAIASHQPFNSVASDLTVSNISGFDITVSDVSDLSVGDYIALAGTSPFPQLPTEAHQLLVQGAKVQMLDSQGDTDGWKVSKVKYDQIEKSLLQTITPRVDGQYKKVVSRNTVFNFASRGR